MLWLDNNELTGGIPDSLERCQQLHIVWLNHNNLTGGIPEFFGSMPKLEQLYLQHNQLNGDIPEALVQKCKRGDAQFAVQGNPIMTGNRGHLDISCPLFPFWVMHRATIQSLSFIPTFLGTAHAQ